jgi:hypothetical protein
MVKKFGFASDSFPRAPRNGTFVTNKDEVEFSVLVGLGNMDIDLTSAWDTVHRAPRNGTFVTIGMFHVGCDNMPKDFRFAWDVVRRAPRKGTFIASGASAVHTRT